MDYKKKDIDRFFEGKLSKKVAKDFLKWLDSPAGSETYNSIIEDIWTSEISNTEPAQEKEDPHLPEIANQKIGIAASSETRETKSNKKSKLVKLSFGLAASLVLVLSVSYIFYSNTRYQKVTDNPISVEPVTIERISPRGNKKLISLPDGSLATLNADSKLTYKDDFIHNRTLTLEGEGFFEVVRDEKYPFTVITNNISTTALGTSFNIKAYKGNPNIEVTLASGLVLVENILDKNQVEIQPGEAVHYSEDNRILQKQNVDLQHVLGWKKGILHFQKTPFNEIVEDLERWYGVEIEIKGIDQIPQYKCSGTFQPNEYLSNVLKVLSYSVEFEYTINGNEVILEFK
jgi:transmembrane sensor